jgi:DNA-binding transcriptional LysR family regulator
MNLDLRKLRHATVLAEELSFARAADRLHISQSALSQSILRLEDDVGIKLFDRDRRGVVLTAAGRTFVERAASLLQHVRGFDHDMTLMRDCAVGNVHFGIGPLPAASFLPALLRDIAREQPQLNVQVDINSGQELFELLLAEKIEFFVADRRHVARTGNIATRPLVEWQLACYVRPAHPLLALDAVQKADLSQYPIISVRATEQIEHQHWDVIEQLRVDALKQTIRCDDIYILKEVALSTDAILITTQSSIVGDLAAGKLQELVVRDMRKASVNMIIVSLANRSLSPAAALVIEKFRQLAGPMSAQ